MLPDGVNGQTTDGVFLSLLELFLKETARIQREIIHVEWNLLLRESKQHLRDWRWMGWVCAFGLPEGLCCYPPGKSDDACYPSKCRRLYWYLYERVEISCQGSVQAGWRLILRTTIISDLYRYLPWEIKSYVSVFTDNVGIVYDARSNRECSILEGGPMTWLMKCSPSRCILIKMGKGISRPDCDNHTGESLIQESSWAKGLKLTSRYAHHREITWVR